MGKVILDSQWRSKLNGMNGPVEICDEAGVTMGHFLPDPLYREFLVAWSKAHISDEELQRRRQEPRGRTLAEIWKRLGQS